MSWTKIAVVAGALFTIFTIIALESLAGFHQCIKQRNQLSPALGQFVFDTARKAAVVVAQYQVVAFHLAQATHQSSTTDRMKILKQLSCSLGAGKKITDDQHRPLVSN